MLKIDPKRTILIALWAWGCAFSQAPGLPDASPAPLSGANRALAEAGRALYRKGAVCIWAGLPFFALSGLALVPVLDDGAFGITAADPGFAIAFALAGAGLIHTGIPILGWGADKMAAAARGLDPGLPPTVEAGWFHYRLGWIALAGGSVCLLAAVPFAAASGLDFSDEKPSVHYAAAALVTAGLGLGAAGMFEQYRAGYLFRRGRVGSQAALRASGLTLQPLLRLERAGGWGAGARLAAVF